MCVIIVVAMDDCTLVEHFSWDGMTIDDHQTWIDDDNIWIYEHD